MVAKVCRISLIARLSWLSLLCRAGPTGRRSEHGTPLSTPLERFIRSPGMVFVMQKPRLANQAPCPQPGTRLPTAIKILLTALEKSYLSTSKGLGVSALLHEERHCIAVGAKNINCNCCRAPICKVGPVLTQTTPSTLFCSKLPYNHESIFFSRNSTRRYLASVISLQYSKYGHERPSAESTSITHCWCTLSPFQGNVS